MKIEIKGIQNKENEWQPQEQIFFSQDLVNDIIKEEDLKTNMVCKQNVGFNTANQTLTNVVFNCENYNGEFIYLVKSKDIVQGRKYHFAYVSAKDWNTPKKVVLELIIDTVTSNYDLFYKNQFKGQAYIERANNYQREVNNFHSDICSGIDNNERNLIKTNKEINTDIDIFVDQKTRTIKDRILIADEGITEPTKFYFDTSTYGTAITNELGGFIAYSSTIPTSKGFIRNEDQKEPPLIDDLLYAYAVKNTKFTDKNWHFKTPQLRKLFLDQISSYGHDNTQLNDITNIGNDTENINSWLSVPKYFDGVDNNIFSYFTFKIDELPNFDLKKHSILHKNYFVIVGKTFKIPIDLLRIKNKKMYVTRIVSQQNVIFKFYYENDRIDAFYEVRLNTANGLNDDAWKKYQRDLDIAYNTGQKGITNDISNTTNSLLNIMLGALLSGGALGPGIVGVIGASAISSGFSAFSNWKQEKYNAQQILSKGNETKNILLYEALNDILFYNAKAKSYGNFYSSTEIGTYHSYFLMDKQTIDFQGDNLIKILEETPLKDDIIRIDEDQKMFGNIVNQNIMNIDNILVWNNTLDHLYWQGKILPNLNPIDSFQLTKLNETLAKGVYIYKTKPTKFKKLV